MKKLLVGTLVIGMCLLGVLTLKAASNRIRIVSENNLSKQLDRDGMHITNIINTANTDLENGKVAIEIIIDNSKNTEIFYAIDNSTKMSEKKESVIDSIKTNAHALEGYTNIKQGVVTKSNGEITSTALEYTDIQTKLDSVKSAQATEEESNILDLVNEAASKFTSNADVKVIIIAVNNLPSDQNALKSRITELSNQGIKIIVYGIDAESEGNFDDTFTSADFKNKEQTSGLNISFIANIMSYLPAQKNTIASTISFDNYILNNFDIVELHTEAGVARIDEGTKNVIWEVGDIETNQVVKLTYYLQLKSVVDSSIIERMTLRTNRQIKVTKSGQVIGTYPSDETIEDEVCSPTIMILKEAIDNPVNPDTGLLNYIVGGSCMLAVAAITIVILRSKNQFNNL